MLTFLDITERKNAELRREEIARSWSSRRGFRTRRSRPIADFAYTFDRQGRFIFANRPLCETLGRTASEVAGRTFHELGYPPGLAAKLQAQVEHVFTTRETVVDETPFTSASGQEGYYEYIFQPVVQPDGRVEVVAGSTRVITERKRMEAELRTSEEKLRLIVENAREYAIFSLALDRRITSWNSGAERILGYTQEEAIGQSGDIIFTGEDRAAGAPVQEAQKALAEGRAADERWHICKNGTRFWGSGVMMAMHDAGGNAIGLVKIFRDEPSAAPCWSEPRGLWARSGDRARPRRGGGRRPREGSFPGRALPRASHAADSRADGRARPLAAERPAADGGRGAGNDPAERADRGAFHRRPARPHAHQPRQAGRGEKADGPAPGRRGTRWRFPRPTSRRKTSG